MHGFGTLVHKLFGAWFTEDCLTRLLRKLIAQGSCATLVREAVAQGSCAEFCNKLVTQLGKSLRQQAPNTCAATPVEERYLVEEVQQAPCGGFAR